MLLYMCFVNALYCIWEKQVKFLLSERIWQKKKLEGVTDF